MADDEYQRNSDKLKGRTNSWHKTQILKASFLDKIKLGHSIQDARTALGVTVAQYEKWRQRDAAFRARIDEARTGALDTTPIYTGDHASFAHRYFGMTYAWFHLIALQELETMPLGNILMVLFPPEHGKTTLFENYASETLARTPEWRSIVVGESQPISRKIIGRIRSRLSHEGPFPNFVNDWGPFEPQKGAGQKVAQPWGADFFNVYKKGSHDERDYSMNALGANSSIVSARADHLHGDDLQSTKTLNMTDKLLSWYRQDALTRTGESGRNTIFGTRVGDGDFYEELEQDEDLSGILKVVRFPAIITDRATGEQKPLWDERYSMDQLDRMRRKAGPEAWSRNYMQNPAISNERRTFTDDAIERVLHQGYSLMEYPEPDSIVYVGVDPALGSKNCIIACELTATQLIVRHIREDTGFRQNEQIMSALSDVINRMQLSGARVSDVVVESKNFQAGLARDERLIDMRDHYGFALREHLTGWNKYDADIGVPSMVSSFMSKEIVLPWHDDPLTRAEIGEMIVQLKAWKPGARGNKLRQDRVMALWFVWILWRQRWKSDAAARGKTDGWRRQGVPWRQAQSGLVLPPGVRP
jgi:hypothetical protein